MDDQELENQLRRAWADYDNLKKRFQKEAESITQFANEELLIKLTSVNDDFKRVLEHLPEELKGSSFEQGLQGALGNFQKVLQGEGLEEIEVKPGDSFDPALHEAVEVVSGEEEDKIVAILTKGYKLLEKVIRPVRVKVSKQSKDSRE